MADITKLDLYDILGVTHQSTEKQILKAYRKRALKCHPDKNPDNPKAAEQFHQLSRALEVLTDGAARAAYDKILKAKQAAQLRHKELDGKRKKFKEDLEARENVADNEKAQTTAAKRNLQAEIERLRKEGSSLLEKEQELLKEELNKEQESRQEQTGQVDFHDSVRLKLKWKAKKSDESNGGYNEEYLEDHFKKYGTITALIVSAKKKGSAIIEFESAASAQLAVENEIGLTSNPLILTWLSGQPPAQTKGGSMFPSDTLPNLDNQYNYTPASDERNFESLVLMRMRQAEERKRLIEQMKRQDDEDELSYDNSNPPP